MLPAIVLMLTTTLLPTAPIDFTVSGVVPVMGQPTTNACWATVATMMTSWKQNQSVPIVDVMTKAGPQFVAKFNANQGLPGNQKAGFLTALGMKAEAPQNFTIEGWLGLLKTRGALWVTTNEGAAQTFAVHARIVKGIFGDGTPAGTFFKIVDPANGGSESSESVQTFIKKLEDVAKADLGAGADLRPQVVHF